MFCEKCGNELMDEAVICTKCGCLIKNSRQQIGNIRQKNKQGDASGFLSWSSFILALCAIFSSIMYLVVVCDGYYEDLIFDIYRFSCIFSKPSISGWLSIYALKKKFNLISLFALIMSGIALVIQVVAIFSYHDYFIVIGG